MKEAKICLCPESIKWIKKHLLKSARAKFNKLLKKGTIKDIIIKKKRSKKQLANDKKLGKMAKARARKAKRRKR